MLPIKYFLYLKYVVHKMHGDTDWVFAIKSNHSDIPLFDKFVLKAVSLSLTMTTTFPRAWLSSHLQPFSGGY